LKGAGSVILSPDRKFLFATNGGDNSVSSFAVGDQGRLTLIGTKPTGNTVEGKSGTAKSLAYSPSKDMLYVVHSFGPDHIRLMSVSSDGKLTPGMERYTAITPEKPHRVPTMGVLSPDEKFLLVATTFDLPIAISGTYPDGSPILWVPEPDGKPRSVASNAPDPDGIVGASPVPGTNLNELLRSLSEFAALLPALILRMLLTSPYQQDRLLPFFRGFCQDFV
jgi:WD40 repeat protein